MSPSHDSIRLSSTMPPWSPGGYKVGLRKCSKLGGNGATQRFVATAFTNLDTAQGEKTLYYLDSSILTSGNVRELHLDNSDVEDFRLEPSDPNLELVDPIMIDLRLFRRLATTAVARYVCLEQQRQGTERGLCSPEDEDALRLKQDELKMTMYFTRCLGEIAMTAATMIHADLSQKGLLETKHSSPSLIPDGYGGLPSRWEETCCEPLRHEVLLRRRLSFYKQRDMLDEITRIGQAFGVKIEPIEGFPGAASDHSETDLAALKKKTFRDLGNLLERDPSARDRTWEQLRKQIYDHSVHLSGTTRESTVQADDGASSPCHVSASPPGMIQQSADDQSCPAHAPGEWSTRPDRLTGPDQAEQAQIAQSGDLESSTGVVVKDLAEAMASAKSSGSADTDAVHAVQRSRLTALPRRVPDVRAPGAAEFWRGNRHLALADFTQTDGETLADRLRLIWALPLNASAET